MMEKNRVKKRYYTAILVLVLLGGIFPRLFHIDYPPIGYHSMKEVHYLSVARGFLEHGDFLHKRVLYSGFDEGEGYIEAFPQLPLLPYIYFALWKAFGVEVWIARLVVILFSLGSVYLGWKVAGRLSGSDDIALLSAFFLTMMPVSVFFGRNIQPDIPAMFFLLLMFLSFLRWIDEMKAVHVVTFSLSLLMTAMIKGTFLMPAMAIFFIFPYGRLGDAGARRRIGRHVLFVIAGLAAVAAWLALTKSTIVGGSRLFPVERLFLARSFTLSYWRGLFPVVWGHIRRSYTFGYFLFFLVGVLWSVLNRKEILARFITGSMLSAVAYFVMISDFAVRHSYYHIPFLPMVCFGAAAGLSEAVSVLGTGRLRRFRYAALAVLVLVGAPYLKADISWHYDILAFGSDVAGSYIREHGEEGERVFISFGSPSDGRFKAYRTQLYGTLWEADKRGNLLPDTLEKLKFGERERGFSWIVLYRVDWLPVDGDILEYIDGNYSIVQIGYRDDLPVYHLLRRGGKVDESLFIRKPARLARTYELTTGEVRFFVKEL